MDGPASQSGKIRVAPSTERYQIVERLGEGGMAVVYRAVDNQERRWVALKVLLPHHRANPSVLQRFADEAQAMATLRHRNLVQVFDVQVDRPDPFFTMELATGGSAVDWVQAHGPMPPRMATDIAIQLCKALRAAHEKGIVHRDVKPHNVLVNRRGVVKLTDFGIARIEDGAGLTVDGTGMGTLGYIAPEQKGTASQVDPRADVYSTGATLHTLLVGHTTMDLYLADQHPEMLDGVPEALHEPLIKATRYRPDERYQTIQAFAKALFDAKNLLDDDPEDTPPLVTREATEITDSLDRFVSMPGASIPPPDDETWRADNEPSGSAPSLSRDDLLRPHEEIEEARFFNALNLRNLAIGSLPLWALAFMFILLISMRTSVLTRSVERVELTEAHLDEAVAAEAALVQELSAIGGDADRLNQLWSSVERNQGTARVQSLSTLLLLAEREATDHKPAPGASNIHLARSAEQRITRLRASLSDVERAREWDQDQRSDPFAAISTAIGVAPPPPP